MTYALLLALLSLLALCSPTIAVKIIRAPQQRVVDSRSTFAIPEQIFGSDPSTNSGRDAKNKRCCCCCNNCCFNPCCCSCNLCFWLAPSDQFHSSRSTTFNHETSKQYSSSAQIFSWNSDSNHPAKNAHVSPRAPPTRPPISFVASEGTVLPHPTRPPPIDPPLIDLPPTYPPIGPPLINHPTDGPPPIDPQPIRPPPTYPPIDPQPTRPPPIYPSTDPQPTRPPPTYPPIDPQPIRPPPIYPSIDPQPTRLPPTYPPIDPQPIRPPPTYPPIDLQPIRPPPNHPPIDPQSIRPPIFDPQPIDRPPNDSPPIGPPPIDPRPPTYIIASEGTVLPHPTRPPPIYPPLIDTPPIRPPTYTVDSEDSYLSSSLLRVNTITEQRMSYEEQGRFDRNCNSRELREILVQCIAYSPSESKQRINAAIARRLDGSFGIVCTEGAFSYLARFVSYLAHTTQFCHLTRNNITCLVFRDSES